MAGVERSTSGFLAVPLCVGDESLGVVVVGYDGELLPEIDVQFAEAAAGHLAQALARRGCRTLWRIVRAKRSRRQGRSAAAVNRWSSSVR